MEFICINIAQKAPIKWPKCFQKFLFHFQHYNPWQPIIFEEKPVKFWKFRGRTRERMIEIEQEWHFRLWDQELEQLSRKKEQIRSNFDVFSFSKK